MATPKPFLILHCGPMKTGSTAIQDTLAENLTTLNCLGIAYAHLRAKTMHEDLRVFLQFSLSEGYKYLLASSEFLAQVNITSLSEILKNFDLNVHAIFVARPLRELYPSLYLQNLKGSSCRTTSFHEFLVNQMLNDEQPDLRLSGQLFNFPVLNERLVSVGAKTHWIKFSKSFLVADFLSVCGNIFGLQLNSMPGCPNSSPEGLSPRRSLRMEVAWLCVNINRCSKLGIFSKSTRKCLLILMLRISLLLNWLGVKPVNVSEKLLNKCDDLDVTINGQFLHDRLLSRPS